MLKIGRIILGLAVAAPFVRAAEIGDQGRVCFQLNRGQIVQFADALSIEDIREDQWKPVGTTGCDEGAAAAMAGTDMLRFYRVRPGGESTYAFGVVNLHPGRNWIGLWGDPEINSVRAVFGDRMPTGTLMRIMQPGSGAEIALLLAEDQAGAVRWMSGENPADETEIPAEVSAVEVELPPGCEPVAVPVILKVPAAPVEQILSYGKRTLGGFRCPGRPRLDRTGLLAGGFTGGANPVESDQLWKYDRLNQRAPYAVWFCTRDNTWRLTVGGPDFPVVPADAFRYDDAVMVMPRKALMGIRWRKGGSVK
ncbi:MAG: hypothetical protein PHD86_06300 [Kiritimatiellae bacterium]|nr:hypothetical protein [Kiritimatiellia bacterium]